MKTRKTYPLLTLLLGAFLVLALNGCKKDEDPEVYSGAEERTHSADESQMSTETDQVLSETEDLYALGSAGMGGSGKTSMMVPCGATLDSVPATKTYILTFDGTTACVNGTRTRQGTITLQLVTGNQWQDVGAELQITYTNYKVTRLSDGKTLTLNGTHTIVNTTGGLVPQMQDSGPNIIRNVTGNLALTFDDATQRTWNVSVQRTWTKANGVWTVSTAGQGTAGGHSNLSQWGTTRFGGLFYVETQQPVVANSTCGWFKPISGRKLHHRPVRSVTVTLGVDANGNANTSSNCAYGFKVEWVNTNSGNTGTAIVSY